MNLCFTGRGAMLNSEEGNNCAYFEAENNLYLIDCGEDVSRKLIKNNKLKGKNNVYLFCTHTHCDHFGSVGTLVTYLYYVCGKVLKIVYDENVEYKDQMLDILKSSNVESYQYEFIKSSELPQNKYLKSVEFVKTDHGDENIKSCGLIIDTPKGKILYTSDIKDEQVIIDFITNTKEIDKIYVDTSFSETPVHLNFEKLKEIIPIDLRDRVYCMHFDDTKLLSEVKKNGFHFVTKINNLNKLDIEEILSKYNLNKNQYKILSGASLVLQDVKETTRDIDITVDSELFDDLLQNYNCIYEKTNDNGTKVYMLDDVINFSTNFYDETETLEYQGVNIQTLENIKVLKKNLNRDKDKIDLYLIDKKTRN